MEVGVPKVCSLDGGGSFKVKVKIYQHDCGRGCHGLNRDPKKTGQSFSQTETQKNERGGSKQKKQQTGLVKRGGKTQGVGTLKFLLFWCKGDRGAPSGET